MVEGPGVCGCGITAAMQAQVRVGAYVSVEDKRPRASVRDERLAAQLRPGWRGLHEEKRCVWGLRRGEEAIGDGVLVSPNPKGFCLAKVG